MSKFEHLLAKKPVDSGKPVEVETLFLHTLQDFKTAKILTEM